MTTPDLTPADRDTLNAAIRYLDSSDQGGGVPEFYDRLVVLRDACPERPALEDGIYEEPDPSGDHRLRYVLDGRHGMYLRPDGTLTGGGYPLPADVSGWRRIDGPTTVTPEQIEALAREISGLSDSRWTMPEAEKDLYRDLARRYLTAAEVEVQP